MTHISRNSSADFFYHRCVRIIPLYFLITLALFVVKLKALLPFGIFQYLAIDGGSSVGLTLMTLAKSLLFIPYKNPSGEWQPINAVGWTLNLEMYFYVIYSIALLVSTRFAPVMVSIVVLLVNLLGGTCIDNACAFYAHSYTNYFVLGILAYYSWQAVMPWLERGREAERQRGREAERQRGREAERRCAGWGAFGHRLLSMASIPGVCSALRVAVYHDHELLAAVSCCDHRIVLTLGKSPVRLETSSGVG